MARDKRSERDVGINAANDLPPSSLLSRKPAPDDLLPYNGEAPAPIGEGAYRRQPHHVEPEDGGLKSGVLPEESYFDTSARAPLSFKKKEVGRRHRREDDDDHPIMDGGRWGR